MSGRKRKSSSANKVQFVEYVGKADARILSRQDLKNLGVQDVVDGLVWDHSNDKKIPANTLSESTVRALVALDEFVAK